MDDYGETFLGIERESKSILDHVGLQELRVLECVTHAHEHIAGGLAPVGSVQHVILQCNLEKSLVNRLVQCEGVVLKAVMKF